MQIRITFFQKYLVCYAEMPNFALVINKCLIIKSKNTTKN